MQEFMQAYKDNTEDIEKFLIETIKNTGDLATHTTTDFIELYKIFPSLELVYICDKDDFIQSSPNIYRDKATPTQIGSSRKYLLSKLKLDDKGVSVSAPYISSATGRTCVTVAKEESGKVFLLDFELRVLLQRLGLVNVHKQFNLMSKSFYFITGNIMMLLALFTVGYALYDFFHSLFIRTDLSIESIFKPVIALTLGLAIFDLAKTVLEQEVVFKSYSKNWRAEYKGLIKFSITIIIALLV